MQGTNANTPSRIYVQRMHIFNIEERMGFRDDIFVLMEASVVNMCIERKFMLDVIVQGIMQVRIVSI